MPHFWMLSNCYESYIFWKSRENYTWITGSPLLAICDFLLIWDLRQRVVPHLFSSHWLPRCGFIGSNVRIFWKIGIFPLCFVQWVSIIAGFLKTDIEQNRASQRCAAAPRPLLLAAVQGNLKMIDISLVLMHIDAYFIHIWDRKSVV